MSASVLAVHRSSSHSFSKFAEEEGVTLVEGLGVQGDAHAGTTVRHRSRVRRDPTAPNLRQVHLLHAEPFDELLDAGHAVFAGDLGENVTTRRLDSWPCPSAPVCAWARRPKSNSRVCATHAARSTASSRV